MLNVGDDVPLGGGDARKAIVVLRKRDGDDVEIVDSSGRAFAATLTISGRDAIARLQRELESPARDSLELVLAQGLPKGAKMDFVVEKATELGASAIVPFRSERTIADPHGGKVERWRRLAQTAARQCGRRDVPVVEEPIEWLALCDRLRSFDLALVPWEVAERTPLRDVLPGLLGAARRVCVIIGPEGGLAHDEVERAVAAGAVPVSLGERILRTETAGLVALTAIRYAAGLL